MSTEDVEKETQDQEIRFLEAKKIPGTRNHHCFIPVENHQFRMFRVSSDHIGTLVVNTSEVLDKQDLTHEYMPGKYVAAMYDAAWYVGNIVERDDGEQDVLVSFMAAAGGSKVFQWPRRKDECWIPMDHILCILPAPSTTSSGRNYQYDDKNNSRHSNFVPEVCQQSFLKHFS